MNHSHYGLMSELCSGTVSSVSFCLYSEAIGACSSAVEQCREANRGEEAMQDAVRNDGSGAEERKRQTRSDEMGYLARSQLPGA